MLTLEPDPDVFPENTEVEAVDCETCGSKGYRVAESWNDAPKAYECKDCVADRFRRFLNPSEDTTIGRADALDRIRYEIPGAFPFRDFDGDLIVSADVERYPSGGYYVSKITKIVDRECPECGHDRADHTRWQHFTVERGESISCRACGHIIEEDNTL